MEAAALVDGVVQLREGVSQLAVADEQLEALGKARVGRAALAERRHLHRVHGDERGLNEVFLYLLVKTGVQGVAPRFIRRTGQLYARGLCRGHSRSVVGNGVEINAHIFLHGLHHGHALPAGGKVHLIAHPFHVIGA